MELFTNLHVILEQGGADLLCIIPILLYVLPKRAQLFLISNLSLLSFFSFSFCLGLV